MRNKADSIIRWSLRFYTGCLLDEFRFLMTSSLFFLEIGRVAEFRLTYSLL